MLRKELPSYFNVYTYKHTVSCHSNSFVPASSLFNFPLLFNIYYALALIARKIFYRKLSNVCILCRLFIFHSLIIANNNFRLQKINEI